jgi:hypothetical protein
VSLGSAAVLVAGAVVIRQSGKELGHPDAWDPRVSDLVAFVEDERGLSFEHPVRVDFLTTEEYSDASRVDEEALTEKDRRLIEESSAILEALGMVPAGTDMFDTTNEMTDAGTLAFYDPLTETVSVRGTELTTVVEVTLVHELTHVAQDQAFDLEQPRGDGSAAAYEGFRALAEGDALRIELAYLDTLSPQEQAAYWADYGGQVDQADADLAEVPPAVQAMFAAPYVLGDPLVAMIAADGGNAAMDDAFVSPPASGEHLLNPRSFFAGDAPVDVDEPDVPPAVDRLGAPDVLGAVGLFVMLSQRIDPVAALGAADGWGGDRYAAYDDGTRTCAHVDLVADSPADRDELAGALRTWVDTGPDGAGSVAVLGDTVALESCAIAPGQETGPAPAGGALGALNLPAARAQFAALGASETGLAPDAAAAYGQCVVDRLPLDAILQAGDGAEPSAEVTAAVEQAIVECRG